MDVDLLTLAERALSLLDSDSSNGNSKIVLPAAFAPLLLAIPGLAEHVIITPDVVLDTSAEKAKSQRPVPPTPAPSVAESHRAASSSKPSKLDTSGSGPASAPSSPASSPTPSPQRLSPSPPPLSATPGAGVGPSATPAAAASAKWGGADKELMSLWRTMSRHKTYPIFKQPVTEEEAPNYHSIVTHPMDMKTMKTLIETNVIACVEDLKRATHLMCDNCIAYNGADSGYGEYAADLKTHMAPKFEEAAAKEKASGRAMKPSWQPTPHASLATPSAATAAALRAAPATAGSKRKRDADSSVAGDDAEESTAAPSAKRSSRRVSGGPVHDLFSEASEQQTQAGSYQQAETVADAGAEDPKAKRKSVGGASAAASAKKKK